MDIVGACPASQEAAEQGLAHDACVRRFGSIVFPRRRPGACRAGRIGPLDARAKVPKPLDQQPDRKGSYRAAGGKLANSADCVER
jgi:hypothetical protein